MIQYNTKGCDGGQTFAPVSQRLSNFVAGFLIPRLFKVVTAALLKTVDSARCKELEGGLAEGLLRWNRPPSQAGTREEVGKKLLQLLMSLATWLS